MPDSLKRRFGDFIISLPHSENVDDLEIPAKFRDKKRADYLIENRKVVIEQKSLDADPEYKIHEKIDDLRERDEYPLTYGKLEFQKILKYFPDRDQINEKLFYLVSRRIEKVFRSADKQIKSTKEIFACNNASGLLVLLNESIDALSPEIVSYRVSQLLTKKDSEGEYRYPHITSVWLICENYTYRSARNSKMMPCIIVDGPTCENYENLDLIHENLQKAWASFNRIPFIDGTQSRITDSDFVALSSFKKEHKKHLSRHEVWRKNYRRDPYLRSLSDEAVLQHGARILNLMKPHFLKGEKKHPYEVMAQFMEGWTHFLEESEIGSLDLRKMNLAN